MHEPVERVGRTLWRDGVPLAGERAIPNEVAIAITYGGSTQAVMMATPADLEDFALGFGLTEGLISAPEDVQSLEVIDADEGIELRMWLSPELGENLSRRRRLLAGPTGCGLCGIESLEEAVKPPRQVVAGTALLPAQVSTALDELSHHQIFNRETRAMHAAGFWDPTDGLVAVREDVGRHNALDKLAGHLLRSGRSPRSGIVALTSRVSVEMVQKAAAIGAPVIAAISAPTALAIRTAQASGITLIAVVRGGEFEVFTEFTRIGDTDVPGHDTAA